MFEKIKEKNVLKSKWSYMIISAVITMIVLSGIMVIAMKTSSDDLMINEHKSKFNTIEETVQAIYDGVDAFNTAHSEEIEEIGAWSVIDILNVTDKIVAKHPEFSDMKETKILSLCNAKIAYDMLGEDGRRKISTMMPCAIGVYEKSDGIYISGFDMNMFAMIMPSNIGNVLKVVAEADAEILSHAISE
ncbi:hypothetical protein B6U98_02285 [Thermoplasmatales archaeon ex4572_165]|nr:MAG: hypothetical protein B6U98_02285 [Thermoplasmatales archaeon ex4572_165]